MCYMMDISDELKQLAGQPGWHVLEDGTPALVVQSALTFQDVSKHYDATEYPFRSTLIKVNEEEYDCVECSQMWINNRMGELDVVGPSLTITLLHKEPSILMELENSMIQGRAVGGQAELFGEDPRHPVLRPQLLDLQPEVPHHPEEPHRPEEHGEEGNVIPGEPQGDIIIPEELAYEEFGDDHVMVDGVKVEANVQH